MFPVVGWYQKAQSQVAASPSDTVAGITDLLFSSSWRSSATPVSLLLLAALEFSLSESDRPLRLRLTLPLSLLLCPLVTTCPSSLVSTLDSNWVSALVSTLAFSFSFLLRL